MRDRITFYVIVGFAVLAMVRGEHQMALGFIILGKLYANDLEAPESRAPGKGAEEVSRNG